MNTNAKPGSKIIDLSELEIPEIMKDLKNLLQMMSRLLILVVLVGCSSKGAILYSPDTRDDIEGYISETLELVNSTGDSLEVVFHRAGSIQEYAKNVNEHDFKYDRSLSSVKDVTVLMDRSFIQLEADGIEIDAQTIYGSQTYTNVYIVHDKIDEKNLSQMSEAYLENNTLTNVLRHFIQKQYFDSKKFGPSGKYIFIELKIPKKRLHLNHSPLNLTQKQYIEQIIDELQDTIESAVGNSNMSAAIRRHIGFASFNLYALEYANRYSMNQQQHGYRFHFIAGTNRRLIGYLANIFFSTAINYLDDNLTQRLISHKWLTGIWFDPAGINRIAETFNKINSDRDPPLFLYMSTYNLKRQSFFNKLRKDVARTATDPPTKLENVRGLIFDIQVWEN